MIPSTQRFSDRVDYYVRSRPKYPAALMRFFLNDLELSPKDSVADIGSGTGFLTELFVRNGNPTFGVEPNGPMRAAAEQSLSEWSNFHSIDGTAEATTLPDASIDFVTAAQAFHWFNAERAAAEFRRILKPNGYVALVWNERRVAGSPCMLAYQQLIQKYRVESESIRSHVADASEDQRLRTLFGPAGYQVRTFDNPQMLDREGMLDRLASSSYMPLPDHPSHAEMLKDATAIFDAHQQNQSVRITHDTMVFYGQLS